MRPPAAPRSPRRSTPPAARAGGRPGNPPGGPDEGSSQRATTGADRTGETTRGRAPAARVVVPRREPASVVVRRGMDTVSTGLRERLAERNAAERRLLIRKVLATVAVLLVLVGLGWLTLVSPLLALRAPEVAIEGTGTTVDPAAVHAAVEPEVGTPLARLDLAAMATRIEELQAVESVSLARQWPNGLGVSVVSREPVAAAAQGEEFVLLDADGVHVGMVDEVPEGLPEVTVPLEDAEQTGPALAAVLEVVGALPEDVLTQVKQAGARSARDVELVLDDGATVRWGSAEENELKLAVLEVLRQRPAGVYDVSVPRAPTTQE